MGDRKSRQIIKQDSIDLLKPIDVLTLGGNDDPCFGMHHDLKAPECMECGDSDFCAIVKAQGLHKERLDIEKEQRFKDIEEADDDMVKKKAEAEVLILEAKTKELPRLKTILNISEILSIPKEIVKQLYDQI